jgi:DNA-binding transcriptional MerR regulator
MPPETDGLSIGDIADRTGLSVHTLRYYEREGLLAGPVPRSEGGHRVYNTAHVELLEICKTLRASGMPLESVRRFVGLVREGSGAEAELTVLREHQHRLSEEITELADRMARIRHKIGRYEHHTCGAASSSA